MFRDFISSWFGCLKRGSLFLELIVNNSWRGEKSFFRTLHAMQRIQCNSCHSIGELLIEHRGPTHVAKGPTGALTYAPVKLARYEIPPVINPCYIVVACFSLFLPLSPIFPSRNLGARFCLWADLKPIDLQNCYLVHDALTRREMLSAASTFLPSSGRRGPLRPLLRVISGNEQSAGLT